ncbi:helix-turn-helix domain-containing protein [[Pasteurella] aerogenes]|nr:helix-turn-helix domain-containing protein [[Pasteurella] aerogenes]UWZ92672.1 helix-turn-helix domain-containing protein [[Pasteurella] aerogenes]
MSHPYQFRLDIIKLVIEQDVGIREVAKLHHIPHSSVINWLKAFRKRGLDGVKSPYKKPHPPKRVKPKMKKKEIEVPEPTDLSPQAFKKLQRELAYLRAENAYLKKLEELDRQKQRQKKEKSSKR